MKTKTNTMIPDVLAATNRYLGYGYNEIGAVTSDGSYQFSYDAVGQELSKTYNGGAPEYYLYTPSDERIGVQRGAWWTWSVRDEAGKVLRQYKSSVTNPSAPSLWVEDFVWRDGLLLGSQRPVEMGGRRHFHLDHLGSPRLITSDNGQLVSYHDYYPFGDEQSPVAQEGPSAGGFDREEPMKFTGHERDYAGGMGGEDGHAIDDMHARYYNPSVGRFLSVGRHDFWRADPGNQATQEKMRSYLEKPQNWNRYAYVLNNPLGLTDPTGEKWLDVIRNTLDWALGRGSEHKVYVPPSNEVADMKNAPEVNHARQFFLQKNAANIANKQPLVPVLNFNGKFGLKGLVKAGTNSTQQFVGSFTLDIRPEPSGMVRYTVTNTTSFTSLMYGKAPDWNRSTFSPGGNADQVYTWTEKAP